MPKNKTFEDLSIEEIDEAVVIFHQYPVVEGIDKAFDYLYNKLEENNAK